MIIELTSSLIGINEFSTYHGYGDPDFTLNEESISQSFNDKESDISPLYYWLYFDNKKYMKDWGEIVFNYFNNDLFPEIYKAIDYEFKLKNISTWSPKEYNFYSDALNFDIIVTWHKFNRAINNYLSDKIDEFSDFLSNNYRSCSGFWSFTANNYEEWKEEFKHKREQEVGSVLRFIIEYENIKTDLSIFDGQMWYENYVNTTELDNFINNPIKENLTEWQQEIIKRN